MVERNIFILRLMWVKEDTIISVFQSVGYTSITAGIYQIDFKLTWLGK